jgi:hypothetical protein
MSFLTIAQADPPAGGAELSEVFIATAIGLAGSAAVILPIILYRAGRMPALERLADFTGRIVGLPGWAAFPLAIQGGALIVAVFGMYWDISIHIDDGRDPGPLANPAHFFILFGLMGVMAAGVFGMALPRKPLRSSLHLPSLGWDAPIGAILIFACGAFSLTAFPLDDVWHRIFGQDVTLWSPTHLMLITGASLSVFGALALYREAMEETDAGVARPERAGWLLAPLAGAMLIGLNTFMAEFDFSVPQFRLDMHPIGLMMAAGLALVSARLVIGPWAALATVGFFLLIRGALTVIVGPLIGNTEPHFPLYLAEAAVVELVALGMIRSGHSIRSLPATFGAIAGAAIGTFGLAAEWGWSHVWAEHPWTESMLPEAAIAAFLMAVAAGTIGGFAGRTLTLRGTRLRPAPYWTLPVAAAVGIGVALWGIPISAGDGGTSAQIRLDNVTPPPERTVSATVTLDPPDAAEGARWLNVTSWQGEEKSVVQQLEEESPGVYRSVEPIPVSGTWKTTVRLHRDDEVLGLPIFMPEDDAIPAPEVPAPASFERSFILDKELLQREQKDDVPAALTTGAYVGVTILTVGLIAILVWGLARIRTRLGADEPPPSGTVGAPSPRSAAPTAA